MATYQIIGGNPPMQVSVDGATVTNNGPGTLYYSDSPDVTSALSEGSLTPGSSVSLDGDQWFVTSGGTRCALDVGLPPVVGNDSLSVKAYGAIGNGTTDDTAAISAAWDAAVTAGKALFFPPGTYYQPTAMAKTTVPLQVFADPGTVTIKTDLASGYLWTIQGSLAGSGAALTANIAQDVAVIPAPTAGLAVDDLVLLSDTTAPFATQATRTQGMLAEIYSIDTGAQLTLKTSSYTPFTTAATAQVRKVTPVENVKLLGLRFRQTNASSIAGLVKVRYARNVEVDTEGIGSGGPGMHFEHCYLVRARVLARDYKDQAVDLANQFGYACSVGGATTLGLFEVEATNVRHAFTTTGIDNEAGEPGNLRISGVAHGCKSAAWDAHAQGYDVVFENCQSIGGRGYGFQLRCKRSHVHGGIVDRGPGGVWLFEAAGACTIKGLDIRNIHTAPDTSGVPGNGIHCGVAMTDIIIDSVTFRQISRNGIRFAAAITDYQVTNCRFHNTGQENLSGDRAGIRHNSTSDKGRITDNIVTDDSGVATANRQFIYGATGGANNYAFRNTVLDTIPFILASAAPFFVQQDNYLADGAPAKPVLVKAGVPVDGDYSATPPNGTIAINTSGAAGAKVYCRVATVWTAIA